MTLLILLFVFALVGVPAYVIGQRSGVRNAWVAFIPFIGTTIILLWSIRCGGWMALLTFVPFVNIFFFLWLVFAVPRAHRRSGLWGLGLLVPFIGMYAYAFTLTPRQYALSHWTA
jgi:hypothetical protein